MKEALSIETERMDEIPLLITHMQRMKLSELLGKHCLPSISRQQTILAICPKWKRARRKKNDRRNI